MSDDVPVEPPTRTHLAIALDGAGWHPGAWREPAARPGELFTAGYWTDLVQEAERGLVDLVTIEDAFSLQSRDPGRLQGRLDAVLTAARVAPVTTHIGLVPTAVVTHTEPFHLAKAIATLDYVSSGRAGVRVQVSPRQHEARHLGRRTFPPFSFADLRGPEVPAELLRLVADQFMEAADYVEVLRRLWDSWEVDAEIRDIATGRFVDREKLHYIDFEGRYFSVKGPSITPRPPQGQPPVAALAHTEAAYGLANRSTDLAFVTPADAVDAARIVMELTTPQVFADVLVLLGGDEALARARKERLDEAAGAELVSDAAVFVGTPVGLADLVEEWSAAEVTGFRLRPAVLPDDLVAVTQGLVPELQRRGLFRTAYAEATLRERLGLPRAANRYATGPA